MHAYRKQRQYTYRHCQLCHVIASYAVIVGMCILMLPMLELATEHAQLAAMYYMNHMNHVHPRHMTFRHTPLELPALNNVLPAVVLQKQLAWSNVICTSYTSPHSRVCLSPAPIASSALGRKIVEVVLLLLLMSGDIEKNPGPVGEYISLMCIVHCNLHVQQLHVAVPSHT